MRAHDPGERDGWRCWLCQGDVDPRAPAGSPGAGTVDHVVPRSRGGGNHEASLGLAHRRGNGHPGSHLPELAWPCHLGALDAAPLWPALARLARRPGSAELVALLPTADAASAATSWATDVAAPLLGGGWTAEVAPAAAGHLHALYPAADPGSAPQQAGRPRPPGPRPRRARRGRR